MFHITNGDSAAKIIRAAALPGDVLSWNDVLHEGPVPEGISFNQLRAVRARFIADCGWRALDEAQREFAERDRALERSLNHDEIILWFEHDLYDQLQLLQLLDWFATCEIGATRLTMICGDEYLGQSSADRLRDRFEERNAVRDDQLDVARDAWHAFRSSDPSGIATMIADNTPALPYVRGALQRHLQQFPSVENGLSRSEAHALDVLSGGPRTMSDTFVESHHKREDAVFLGDTVFLMYMAGLSNVREPLVLTAQGARVTSANTRPVWNTEVMLTDAGRAVVDGTADHVRLNGIDRWLGGVHLEGAESEWRWDEKRSCLTQHT